MPRSIPCLGFIALVLTACSSPVDEAPPSSPEDAGIPTAWLTDSGFPFAVPEDVGMSSARLREIDAVVAEFVDDGKIQGAVTAVARRGQVVHFAAHGLTDVERNQTMQLDSMFRMASSSKPILGVAAMIAIEDGLIAASDPVAKYLPEFGDTKVAVLADPADEDISPVWIKGDPPEHRLVAAHRDVTIHDLLTHTSGLGSRGLGWAVAEIPVARGAGVTLATLTPHYAAMPLDFQPGSRWAYSPGIGLDVVARVLEVVSGKPYEVYLREHVFEPLGMIDTQFFVPQDKQSRLVVIDGLDPKTKGWDQPSEYASASGGLSSTAADFLRFEQMLLNGGELFGKRILSEESVATMTRDQAGDLYANQGKQRGSAFGYTVSVLLDPEEAGSYRGKGAFGWGGAFGTVSWTDPANEIVAVLMVQQPSKGLPSGFERAISEAILTE